MIESHKSIAKARELYLNKGVLKRELLRDEIVYSWVRARLVNLDFDNSPTASIPENTDLNRSEIVDNLFLHDYGINPDNVHFKAIMILNLNGEIEKSWRSDPAERYFFNFSEDSIGTSGIGLAIKNNSKSLVFGHEHYHQYLVDTITVGIPTSNNTIAGFVFAVDNNYSETLRIIEKMPEKLEYSEEKEDKQIVFDPLQTELFEHDWPSCLIGESPEIMKARDRIEKLMDSQLIFISGPKGIGKESTANYIHSERAGGTGKFHAVYCDKIPLQRFKSEWLENSDEHFDTLKVYDIGTVYFENFDILPSKYQRKLLRILDSKLVNSKSVNPSNNKDIAFILSLTSLDDKNDAAKKLTQGLQSRLKLTEIVLPGLTHRKSDMCSILGHMIREELEEDHLFNIIEESNIFEEVIKLNLRFNLRDLDLIARDIVDRVSNNGTLTEQCVYEILSQFETVIDESLELKSLSQVERETIIRTLKALEYNMMRSASILGISRSTLYRKLEQHEIEIESVRN